MALNSKEIISPTNDLERSPFFKPSNTKRKKKRIITPGGSEKYIKDNNEENKSSILGTIGNLMNSIVGAGIIGIAFAIKESGLITGVFLVILISTMADKSIRLLIETAKHIHVPSYEMLCEACFGTIGFYFVCCSMFVMSYGGMIAYLLIIKDTLPVLLGINVDDETSKRWILFLSSFFIIIPLSSQRDIASLAKTSSLNVIFVTILVVLICYYAPVKERIDAIEGGIRTIMTKSILHPRTVFYGVGVLSFAFVVHHATFLICGSLQNPTRERWAIVTHISIFICTMMAMSIGIIGYLAFGERTEGDILNNFVIDTTNDDVSNHINVMCNIARALLCSTMFFIYPIESFVTRHVLVVILFSGRQAHEGNDHAVLARWDRRIILTLFLYLSVLIPALIFNDLGNILALAGSLGGSCLGYIGPGCTFLAVHGEEFLDYIDYKFKSKHKLEAGKQHNNNSDIVYYILLMPLWCAIASYGQETLKDFLQKEALKSPHLNRLGEVKHKPTSAVVVQMNTNIQNNNKNEEKVKDPLLVPRRSSSFDAISNYYGSTSSTIAAPSSPDINHSSHSNHSEKPGYYSKTDRAIGAAIAKKYREEEKRKESTNSTTTIIIEDDPQDDCPHLIDFIISILFIIFGCITIIASFISTFL